MTAVRRWVIEGGDSLPTLPLLARLAKAMDASLTIDLDGDHSAFVFTAHDSGQPDGVSRSRRSVNSRTDKLSWLTDMRHPH
ncbi:hypothetical protein [Streptomyces sp. NBC_00576]|uniref:hypothetical protein n=1 Tax=Streptomyces sp. NBC_00576 TaxID=2903665 RepID=UPI003FCC3C53